MDIDINVKGAFKNLNERLKKIENFLNNRLNLCSYCSNKIYNTKFICLQCNYNVCNRVKIL